ncbi:glycoside hydrolase family 9 protein [Sphingomonas sp.]|uniref:glycoside hydrolase family 9 protein n=1 Tax=Sphingomonas sp. TaxID=28214 RepID=UPI003B3B0A37
MFSRRDLARGGASLLGVALVETACSAAPPDAVMLQLNQCGFLPRSPKRFVMTVAADDDQPRQFRIETLQGKSVFAGPIGGRVYDLTPTTGDHVRIGDFSAFTRPGRYRIRIGPAFSPPFEIGNAVYAPLVRDAARAFYLIRANIALDDPVTGLKHAAGHRSEASLPVNGIARDLTGGWYNAGDYGKWTHMAAISASQMMWLYTLRLAPARGLKLAVSQSFPGLCDLLQQARWGLEWLLKMQNRDGSVLHKIDSNQLYAWGLPPEQDPHPRSAAPPSSADAAVFTGVMLQASQVFAPLDHIFADRCRTAALHGWDWLTKNPAVLRNDANYADRDPRQEILWATCAMAATFEDAALGERAAAGLREIGVHPFFWPTPQLLGAMSLARKESASAAVARTTIIAAAIDIAARAGRDPYGFSADPNAYWWGSNEAALDTAVLCLFAAELGGGQQLRHTAQRLLDYVLGCNALGLSFVTGHGSHCVERPYHWTCRTWGIVMPGWASGGANHLMAGADPRLKAVIARGTPPAKCFVDACEDDGSWASNEGQTSENAALLLAAGLIGL